MRLRTLGLIVTLALSILALASCVSTETVRLRHPVTGHIVQCGPYTIEIGRADLHKLRWCVEDYQRQGYERVPNG